MARRVWPLGGLWIITFCLTSHYAGAEICLNVFGIFLTTHRLNNNHLILLINRLVWSLWLLHVMGRRGGASRVTEEYVERMKYELHGGPACIVLHVIRWAQAVLKMLLKNSNVKAVGCNPRQSLNCLPCTANARPGRMLNKTSDWLRKMKSAYLLTFNLLFRNHYSVFSVPEAAGDPTEAVTSVGPSCVNSPLHLFHSVTVYCWKVDWLITFGTAHWMVCFTIKKETCWNSCFFCLFFFSCRSETRWRLNVRLVNVTWRICSLFLGQYSSVCSCFAVRDLWIIVLQFLSAHAEEDWNIRCKKASC